MSKQIEAMKQALEAMTYADACLKKQLTTKDKHEYAQDLLSEAGTAIREALDEQPEQQVPAFRTSYAYTVGFKDGKAQALAEQPAQEPDPDELTIAYMSGIYEGKKRKPWVGLTDEEFVDLCSADMGTAALIRAVEAKLKEKNSGAQPAREPLTDDRIEEIAARTLFPIEFARAIEAEITKGTK